MKLEALKQQFLDLTDDPIAVAHLAGEANTPRLLYVNKAFVCHFGYAPEELTGSSTDQVFVPETSCPFLAAVNNPPVTDNEARTQRVRLKRADGTLFRAVCTFLVVADDAHGQYICTTLRRDTINKEIVSDVPQPEDTGEQRKNGSSGLSETDHNRLLAALDSFPDPLALHDDKGHPIYRNRAFAASQEEDTFERWDRTGAQKRPPQQIGHLLEKTSKTDQFQEAPHHVIQSVSPTGDTLSIRYDASEFLKRNKATERSRDRLVSALNAYPDPIVIYDSDLKLVFCNDGYAASMSDRPEELIEGMHLKDVLHLAIRYGRYPDAIGREDDWVNEILSPTTLGSKTQDVELDGDIHHRLLRSWTPNGDHVIIRLNSTELVRQKRAAENVQARLIAALNAYPAPFVIYDSNDCLVVCNDAYRDSMSGNPKDLKVGMHRTEVARVAIRAGKIANAIGREEEWMSDAHQQSEVERPIQDLELPDDVHHRLLRSRVENGDLVILRIDTTELVRQRRAVEEYSKMLETANRKITYKALHDDLTDLGNRRYLTRKFEEFAATRKLSGGELAALHIDLDRFKHINDTLGHAAGDAVLLEVSKRIRNNVDRDEVVARIGGDEFVVLLQISPNSTRPEDLAETLLQELSRPTIVKGKQCRLGASVGIARTPLAEVSQLLMNSDLALYKAKRHGRGQLGVFSRSDLEDVKHTKTMADDVLRGIEQSEFIPFYQPQIDAKTGRVVGLEALARWHHPEKGILSPADFLPVATDLNVAGDIDKQIFEKAIHDCQRAFGQQTDPLSISFNVSENRINDNEISAIKNQVDAYTGQVSFELLETIFLEEQDNEFLKRLDQLRNLGVAIEVDDFGSGRASVVALQRINPDRLKIDRRLVTLIDRGQEGLRLLKPIIEIGLALELGVTAEGVETPEQAEILAELGCDRLQGFHFAKPMPHQELMRFLDS